MGIRGWSGATIAIVAAAVAIGVYAPDFAGKMFPAVGPAALRAHDVVLGAKPAPSPAADASKPAVVSVAAAARADYPVFI